MGRMGKIGGGELTRQVREWEGGRGKAEGGVGGSAGASPSLRNNDSPLDAYPLVVDTHVYYTKNA
jgi:hypothetical protein